MDYPIFPQATRLSPIHAAQHGNHRVKHHPKPYLRLIFLLVCTCGLVGGEAALAQTVFNDTKFDVDNDWSSFGPYVVPKDATNAAFSTRQVLGNGVAFLEVKLTRATVSEGSVGTWAALINDTLVWDPADDKDGPIGKIDFLIDNKGGGAWSLAVKQGEFVWIALAKRAILNTTDPVTISIDCLDQQNFVALPGSEFEIQDQPLHPDFSANATPISFGLGVGLSCPSNVDCSKTAPSTFELDNLQVTVKPPFHINAGLNDAWFEPATAGQGFFHVVFPDIELVFLSWFTYDTERPPDEVTAILGEPGHRWLTAQGGYVGRTAMLDIYLTRGGVFDQEDPPPDPAEAIGTMRIEWCDCEKGEMNYNIPSLGLIGNITLERITPDNVVLCEALME
jgi:hypothetical protein